MLVSVLGTTPNQILECFRRQMCFCNYETHHEEVVMPLYKIDGANTIAEASSICTNIR